MGRGDQRSKKGKIAVGSFGKTRLKKKKAAYKPVKTAAKAEEKEA